MSEFEKKMKEDRELELLTNDYIQALAQHRFAMAREKGILEADNLRSARHTSILLRLGCKWPDAADRGEQCGTCPNLCLKAQIAEFVEEVYSKEK